MAFFDRSNSIAKPGFNRWLVPPAALCIHLCIGEAYAFSVFTKPMSQAIGITAPAPGVDWTVPELGWIFSLAILVLGLSAAFGGKWVERAGPRKAMLVAAVCFSGGLILAGIGVNAHLLWLVYLGYGVVGGCGLGIGYISPVSTLIKWFPDRPGLATGTAIMGFGGGAMIGAPLSVLLMKHFANASGTGVAQTMIVLGVVYFIWMFAGSLIVRIPQDDWKPAGYVAPAASQAMITSKNVVLEAALRTPQFYLLWLVLFLNVTAGIGVIGQASLMIQDIFGVTAVAAAGFVGLISLFNMGGRIFWASLSDFIGRKRTYAIFFIVGAVLYAFVPTWGHLHAIVLFVVSFLLIITMYGGGFATVPAYLRDLYGTVNVGAIHGALLTAWSAAGIAGPVLINYIREYEIHHGVAKADAYSVTMYLMAALLVVGLLCDLSVRPVAERYHLEAPAQT
ncbi:MAG: OFA family MFS transporter [Candidatus Cybelea sp.]|jgi:MFS family permease